MIRDYFELYHLAPYEGDPKNISVSTISRLSYALHKVGEEILYIRTG